MAIVKELKNLGKKMTGGDISGNIVSEALKAIEQGYSGGGAAADSYELVEEIEVGEMTYDDHDKMYYAAFSPSVEFNSEDYYLGDEKEKSTSSDSHGVIWNSTEDLERVDPDKPIVGVSPEGAFSDEDISGQTLKIYKKVAEPSGGNDDFIINATLTPGNNTFEISDANAGFADIVSAVNAGKTVKLRASADPAIMSLLKAELVLSTIIGDGGADSFAAFYGAANYDEAANSRILVAIAEPASVGDGLDFTTHMYVPAPYEFHYTATPTQSEDAWIATPADPDYDKYSNILDALSQTPLVFAVISIPAKNQVVRALFSVDYTETGSEFLSALAMFWSGTKFMGARLAVPASGDPTIIFHET